MLLTGSRLLWTYSIGVSAAMLIAEALTAACQDVLAETQRVPLEHWNESVFRFFLVRQILAIAPGVECHTEWNRIDLAIRQNERITAVELKFFGTRPRYDHSGRTRAWKGGAGAKNFAESRT